MGVHGGGRHLNLDPRERARFAEQLRGRLAAGLPGSVAELQGSLARGGSDPYSDIDVLWEVDDDQFDWCVRNIQSTLASLHRLESLRFDPAFQDSKKRRRLHARFEGFPLFWQLDLEIMARSIRRDPAYDVGNPSARGPDRSAGESMLMGSVAAIRARFRGRQADAEGLVVSALARIGLSGLDLHGADPVLVLVDEAERRYSDLEGLAGRVRELVRQGANRPAAGDRHGPQPAWA
jgi:predicted nucleotidyltransferase